MYLFTCFLYIGSIFLYLLYSAIYLIFMFELGSSFQSISNTYWKKTRWEDSWYCIDSGMFGFYFYLFFILFFKTNYMLVIWPIQTMKHEFLQLFDELSHGTFKMLPTGLLSYDHLSRSTRLGNCLNNVFISWTMLCFFLSKSQFIKFCR